MRDQNEHNMPDLLEAVRMHPEPGVFRMYLLSREGYLLSPLKEWLTTRGEEALRLQIIKRRRLFIDYFWYSPPFGAR